MKATDELVEGANAALNASDEVAQQAATKADNLADTMINHVDETAEKIADASKTVPDPPPNPPQEYLAPGIGAATRGELFKHACIKHDLYNQLQGLVGKADFNKFLAAVKKGVVGPTGESGIKIFGNPVGKYTHELKIGGSAQRLLGYINEDGVLIFDKFVRGGLH